MSEELVNIQSGLPAHLRDVHSREGLENVRREDLVLPRLSICQSMTPQRKEQNANFIDGLKEGQLFNTVTSEIYGKKVELIPLIFAPSRIYFRDLKEGGGILCQSFNGIDGGTIAPTCEQCPNSKWSGTGAERQAPICTEFANFPALLVLEGARLNMLVASFKSTGLKAARSWVTRMNMTDRPSFAAVYEISTVAEKGTKGDYFGPMIRFKRWTTAEEFAFASQEYQGLKDKTIKTDEVNAEDTHDEAVPF